MKKYRYICKSLKDNEDYFISDLYESVEELIKQGIPKDNILGPCPEYEGLFEEVIEKYEWRLIYGDHYLCVTSGNQTKEDVIDSLLSIGERYLHAINIMTGEIIKKEDLK